MSPLAFLWTAGDREAEQGRDNGQDVGKASLIDQPAELHQHQRTLPHPWRALNPVIGWRKLQGQDDGQWRQICIRPITWIVNAAYRSVITWTRTSPASCWWELFKLNIYVKILGKTTHGWASYEQVFSLNDFLVSSSSGCLCVCAFTTMFTSVFL